MLGEAVLIGRGGVLRAAIMVHEEPGRGPAALQRHLERIEGERPLEGVPHGPAHDFPRGEIEQDREIEPSLARPEIGDVADSRAIGRRIRARRELPVEGIRRGRGGGIAHRGDAPAPHAFGPEPVLPHHLFDALATDATPVRA